MTDNLSPLWKDWAELALTSADTVAWLLDLQDKKHPIFHAGKEDVFMGWKAGEPWSLEKAFPTAHPHDRALMIERIRSLLDGTHNELDAEFRVWRSDGQLRWIQVRGKAIRDQDGKIIRIAGLSRDITEAKKLSEAKDRFVATLSHDVRNPLALAKSITDLMLRYPDRVKEQPNLLQKVSVAIDRADRMIKTLLDWSRAEAGQKVHFTKENFDLREVVKEVITGNAVQYGDRFQFEARGQFDGKWARDAISRILDNLITNAIKYGEKNKPIQIKLERDSQFASISIHNEGNPIPRDDQEHLFEPFYRSRSAIEQGQQGTGLGLAFVKLAVNSLDGRIEVASEPEMGTTFKVLIPFTNGNSAQQNSTVT